MEKKIPKVYDQSTYFIDFNYFFLFFSQKVDSAKVAQDTAMKLLQGAADRPNDVRLKVMEIYCMMHSGEKSHIEKSLESFIQLENQFVSNLKNFKFLIFKMFFYFTER